MVLGPLAVANAPEHPQTSQENDPADDRQGETGFSLASLRLPVSRRRLVSFHDLGETGHANRLFLPAVLAHVAERLLTSAAAPDGVVARMDRAEAGYLGGRQRRRRH